VLIDWFTVGAQALNFVILVWLLKRFLYQPILRAIDAREARVAAELADAAAKEASATQERDEFARKNGELDAKRAALMAEAVAGANAERARLLAEARSAADALSARRREAIRQEADHLKQAVALAAQREVFAIARKTLADLAGSSLEEQMTDVFIRRLGSMDDGERSNLARMMKGRADLAVVRSVSEIPAAQRTEIQHALAKVVASDVTVRFETAAELIGGIELTAGGYKVGWSVGDYLASLEKSVASLVDAPVGSATPPGDAASQAGGGSRQ
jgi:F-type H+-transporting ATPase subunit b